MAIDAAEQNDISRFLARSLRFPEVSTLSPVSVDELSNDVNDEL